MKPFSIFAVVQPGLEDVAQAELSQLGYNDIIRIKGGFFLKGHLSTVIKINLACRCITRVLIEIAQFEARSFAVLEAELEEIPWREYLSNQRVCIHVNSYESKLYHEKAIEERLINTLSNVFNRTINVVSSPDEDNTQLIVVYVKQDIVTVRMDSTGVHLHKRGYGSHKEEAPLRETIAAAMLYKAGWGTTCSRLLDPMCGSGTIAIEAALMLKHNLWSDFRKFAFQKWRSYKPELLDKVKAACLLLNEDNCGTSSLGKSLDNISIIASDLDEKAIVSAKINSFNAGVEDLIDISQLDIDKIIVDKETIIITNPPWGKRLSGSDLSDIWQKLFELSKQALAVYLILPEEQRQDFPFKHETLLVLKAGEIKVRFIKLEA